ncbi:hypothetical protein ACHHYP_07745 [Achlya hypogyna]|uniref:Uncharacterized protein n=1 Tax=Achlya hypogyna TaxID=1202772 RepID=A0A1V9ZLP2_ACHHY|nr:hypothetical protein ACHHYP_07745 [Achlya hypogyna]
MAVASDYSGWVKELQEFKPSTDDDEDDDDARVEAIAAEYTEARPRRGSSSQLEEIKQEMKLLNWHKLANEAALKAALIKTKKLKREDIRMSSAIDAEERLERLQQIEEEENMKPLEVTADFIRKYEEDERREELRLELKVARHITCLKKLKGMVAEREELRARHLRYRDGRAALEKKLAGNQEEDQMRELSRGRLTPRTLSQATSDVTKVLSSLDKLVELERRIACLEQDDYAPPSSAAALLPPKPGLKFAKTSTGRPTAYTVSTKVKPKKPQTFLTAMPEPKRASKQVQRASELRRMPERDRQKAVRMDRRQEETKRQSLQKIKIDQWAEKKRQAAVGRKVNHVKANLRAAPRAATKPAKNPHMEQFLHMKKSFESKKAAIAAAKPTPPPQAKRPLRKKSGDSLRPQPPVTDRLLPLIHPRGAGATAKPTKKPPPQPTKKPPPQPTELPRLVPAGLQLELGVQGFRKQQSR